jgi:hypothetical protein
MAEETPECFIRGRSVFDAVRYSLVGRTGQGEGKIWDMEPESLQHKSWTETLASNKEAVMRNVDFLFL